MEKLLAKGLKISHLRLADALAREAQLSGAAISMGIAQPAASRLASEAERKLVPHSIHARVVALS